MSIRELNLTKEQHDWLNGWLELWGAWVYSGRLEKRMSSVIAKFMESVEPGRVMTRPMCNDDDGMLIRSSIPSCTLTRKPLASSSATTLMVHLSEQLHPTITRLQSHARCVGVVVRDGENLHWQPVETKLTTS